MPAIEYSNILLLIYIEHPNNTQIVWTGNNNNSITVIILLFMIIIALTGLRDVVRMEYIMKEKQDIVYIIDC